MRKMIRKAKKVSYQQFSEILLNSGNKKFFNYINNL